MRLGLLLVWCLLVDFVTASVAVAVRGRLDLSPLNVSRTDVGRTRFRLYELGSDDRSSPYTAVTRISDPQGFFEFENVPLRANTTGYFVLYPYSLDYNLKPNRVLVQVNHTVLDNGTETTRIAAYKNVFGKEYFPSSDILRPQQLEQIQAEPYISIGLVQGAPFRAYYQNRNNGMFQSGPLAGILNSKWKLAAVMTVVLVAAFPFVVEKLDPETTAAIKEEAQRRERAKYKPQPAME